MERRGEVLQQKSLGARRVRFFWLRAVKLHGRGERRRLRDLLQPAPVNQSQPVKTLVGFISSRLHLWLKPAALEAVTPAGRTRPVAVKGRPAFPCGNCRLFTRWRLRKDGLYFVLSGTLQEAVELEVRPQAALWKTPAFWFDQVSDTDIRKGIKMNKSKCPLAFWVWEASSGRASAGMLIECKKQQILAVRSLKHSSLNQSAQLPDKRQWFS